MNGTRWTRKRIVLLSGEKDVSMTLQLTTPPAGTSPASAPRRRLMLVSTAMSMGGGAEEQVFQLAYAFQARNWEVLIVSMLPPGVMPPDFPEHGISLVHLDMRPARPDPRGVLRLADLIRSFHPDVVHSHMTHANLLARAARLLAPFPVLVNTLHNLTMAGVKRNHTTFFEIAHRATDRLAERTTAICHAASDYYVKHHAVPANKMMTVPNGIECQRYAPNPEARLRLRREMGIEDDFVWLAVGRLELQKAYWTMLRAFAKLESPRNTLLICGSGSMLDQLAALATELGLANRVRFLGLRKDIPDVMSAADAFVLSSDMEGLPLVLLQASAAALPIVATNVSGNPEVVIEGLNGFLTPPGSPELFAKAMRRMAALPAAERLALGRAGQARVQKIFQVEPVADQWERLFEELLRADGGRSRRLAPALPATEQTEAMVAPTP
jgi:glycosyltransferase involved in cell wall biosynthesis